METLATTEVKSPYCPNCGRLMNLTRTKPRGLGLPDRHTYECKRCNVVFTEIATGEAPIPERVSALNLEYFDARH